MRNRVLFTLAIITGVLSYACVLVGVAFSIASVLQWMRWGLPERAFWVALSAVGMLVPGLVIALVSHWYPRTRGEPIVDTRQGFDVLPPR